jgi:hypothetical protein
MHVQVPFRQDKWTDVTFSTDDPFGWQGDVLVIGLHQEPVAGESTIGMWCYSGESVTTWYSAY